MQPAIRRRCVLIPSKTLNHTHSAALKGVAEKLIAPVASRPHTVEDSDRRDEVRGVPLGAMLDQEHMPGSELRFRKRNR